MSNVSTAEAVNLVLAELKPLLEAIAARLPLEGELAAIDRGVGAALNQQAENAEKLDRVETALANFSDNFTTLVEEVRGYHVRTIAHYDHLGARVAKLEGKRESDPGEHVGNGR